MTRDQAAQIITDAITNLGQITNTLTPEAHAQRIAAALDATGLLHFAADPQTEHPAVATSESNELTNKQVQSWADTRARD